MLDFLLSNIDKDPLPIRKNETFEQIRRAYRITYNNSGMYSMLNQLEDLGFIKKVKALDPNIDFFISLKKMGELTKLLRIPIESNDEEGKKKLLETSIEFLEVANDNNFIIKQYLQAVENTPERSTQKIIMLELAKIVKKNGLLIEIEEETNKISGKIKANNTYFKTTIDVSSHMSAIKRMGQYLRFISEEKGSQIKLTPLAKKALYPEKTVDNNIIDYQKLIFCKSRAPCQENCPCGAISSESAEYYPIKCKKCSLCSVVCPHGAITFNDDGIAEINVYMCKKKETTPYLRSSKYNYTWIASKELELQHWIKSIFRLSGYSAEIPGSGKEVTDVIIYNSNESVWIEVKTNPISTNIETGGKVKDLIEQMLKYMNPEIIKNTQIDLLDKLNINIPDPDVFLIIAPFGKDINILKRGLTNLLYPCHFLSLERFHEQFENVISSQWSNWTLEKPIKGNSSFDISNEFKFIRSSI